jgi:hypothetical protein
MAARKAARVLPEPVGAAISVWRRAWMEGQPAAWGAVGSPCVRESHAATAGWNTASMLSSNASG